jgi:hypothetical protein
MPTYNHQLIEFCILNGSYALTSPSPYPLPQRRQVRETIQPIIPLLRQNSIVALTETKPAC